METPNSEFRTSNYVNISMVTFNRVSFTREAIASIVQHTKYPYVLTVVDNGSDDGTREYLEKCKQKGFIKTLILNTDNVGVAKASNQAWRAEPDAAYYLKYDNDIVVEKDGWLVDMVAVSDALPFCAAVGYNFEPKSYPLMQHNDVSFRTAETNLGGACFLIPKRTEQLLGYWCEEYGVYGEEDADYCERIRLLGFSHVYMADEHIGKHLPAGRAASIDDETLVAQDGKEELVDRDYRLFKDAKRRRVIADTGLFAKICDEYYTGARSVYIPRDGVVQRSDDALKQIIASNMQMLDIMRGEIPELYFKTLIRFTDVIIKNSLWKELGDIVDEAISFLQRKMNKTSSEWYTLGALCKRIDKNSDACAAFSCVVEMSDSDALRGSAAFHLGDMYAGQNEVSFAEKWYQTCVSLIPRHKKAQEQLRFLQGQKEVT